MAEYDDVNGHDIEIHADGRAVSVTLDGHELELAGMAGIEWNGDRPRTVTIELAARSVILRGNVPVTVEDDADG